MSLRRRIRSLADDAFVRNTSVLASGSMVAQGLAVAVLPLLTRLYSPDDFGDLAVFTATVATVSVAACLRYDIAIPLPDKERDAAGLVVVAGLCALGIAIASAAVLVLLGRTLHLVVLVPVAVFFTGLYSALQSWCVRETRFASVSKARAVQAVAACGVQLGTGLGRFGPLGLLLGAVLGPVAGALVLSAGLGRRFRNLVAATAWSDICGLAAAFSRFPKFSTFEALSNSAGAQVPILLIASIANGAEAGFVFLAVYALQAPMGLLGGAVAQVFLSEAPDRQRSQNMGALVLSTLEKLAMLGIGPILFAGIVAPDVVPKIFGQEWVRSGILMSWMAPWCVMQLLSSPISMALFIANRHETALFLQLFGLALRVGSVLIAAPAVAAEAFALSGFAFYATYLVVVLRVAGVPVRRMWATLWKALPLVLAWSALGVVIALML